MAEVKWIKIAVDIFDNRKIKQIKKMPDGASILNIWFEMLCLAGNVNDGGFIYLTKEIPYTDEMLATHFDEPLGNVRLALNTFKNFGMIEIVDNMIFLSSWEKYQSTDKLAEIREQTRRRVAKHREKTKLLNGGNADGNATSSVTVTDGNATDIDKSKNKNIDIDNKEKESKEKGDASQKDAKPTRHKYGTYKNVLLSDEDLEKLKAEFPTDWENWIERVSEYVASKGKSYRDYLATIRRWARTDREKKQQYDKNSAYCGSNERLDDLDDLF